jgi:hypothetical protein
VPIRSREVVIDALSHMLSAFKNRQRSMRDCRAGKKAVRDERNRNNRRTTRESSGAGDSRRRSERRVVH